MHPSTIATVELSNEEKLYLKGRGKNNNLEFITYYLKPHCNQYKDMNHLLTLTNDFCPV